MISDQSAYSETLISDRRERRLSFFCGIAAVLSVLLLFAVPGVSAGLKALLNRLFTASESRNTYVYTRFDVPDGQAVLPALLLLAVTAACIVVYAAVRRKPLFILACAGLTALGQIYFGLAFPGWVNVFVFGFFALLLVPLSRKIIRFFLFAGVTAVTALMVCLYNAGVDPSIEALSESVRDRLNGAVMQAAGGSDESPLRPAGTRHVNSRTLENGDLSSKTDCEFRPVMIEQEEISRPDTMGRLRKAFPFILAAAAAVWVAFRFYRITDCRKKALERRKLFLSDDISEAVCSMFRHIAAYLTFAGCGSGNRPFRDWVDGLEGSMPADYIRRYEDCVPVFEEAAFSDHQMTAAQRDLVMALLDETESLIYGRADRKQKMHLRYTLCLHE